MPKSAAFVLGVSVLVASCGGSRAPAQPKDPPAQAAVSRSTVPPAAPGAAPLAVRQEDAGGAVADAGAGGDAGEGAVAETPPPPPTSACFEQAPREDLIRVNYLITPATPKEEIKKRQDMHAASVRFRTEEYGHFPGFGKAEWNAHPPSYYTESTTFFGRPVVMHKRVTPSLRCVEAEIKRVCTDKPYQPAALGGIRMKNTYHTGEITNHAYGIAIDIDPGRNPCCGCVPPWNHAPQCVRATKTPYDRMDLPECWVHAFTKFGWYWLGYDPMKDTMHFEFLGDPGRILRSAAGGQTAPGDAGAP